MSASHAGATVRRCAPDAVRALRQAVLRPHQRVEEVVFDGDYLPDAVHFCAEDCGGNIVCIASVWEERPRWEPGEARCWRLRGMATAPAWRGRGLGSAVLAAVVAHVAANGGGLLWCNARLGAVGFYARAGLVATGKSWEEPVIGPHVAMRVHVHASTQRGGVT